MSKNILLPVVASVFTTLIVSSLLFFAYTYFIEKEERNEIAPILLETKVQESIPQVSDTSVLPKIELEDIVPVVSEPADQSQQKGQEDTKVVATSTHAEPSISQFIPAVVKLECFGINDTQPFGSGSGISFYGDDGQHYIATNAHVVRAYDGSVGGCWVYFPGEDGYFYESAYWAGEVYMYDDKAVTIGGNTYGGTTYENGGLDNALLVLTKPGVDSEGVSFPELKEAVFPNLNAISEKTCNTVELTIGDEIWVFGYPDVGGDDMTVTNGIISGFSGDYKEYIKTSAKIEHGNSGGIAIRASDGCLLGIPTQGIAGSMETISYILNYSFIGMFFDALVDSDSTQISDDPYAIPLEPSLSWKQDTNISKATQREISGMLSFDDACGNYGDFGCADYRTVVIPVKNKSTLFSSQVILKKTDVIEWTPRYYSVVDYYDQELAALGFKRNTTLFLPDEKFYLQSYDLASAEDALGGVYRYGRVIGDKIQIVLLVVDVYLDNFSRSCDEYGEKCEGDVKEQYSLYVSEPMAVDALLALRMNVKYQGVTTSLVGSVIHAIRSFIN